jgi:hypothetical protein
MFLISCLPPVDNCCSKNARDTTIVFRYVVGDDFVGGLASRGERGRNVFLDSLIRSLVPRLDGASVSCEGVVEFLWLGGRRRSPGPLAMHGIVGHAAGFRGIGRSKAKSLNLRISSSWPGGISCARTSSRDSYPNRASSAMAMARKKPAPL